MLLSDILIDRGIIQERDEHKDFVAIICPFHDDNTPSLSINMTYGSFRCMACNEEGDILELIARYEIEENPHLSIMQAILRAHRSLSGVEIAKYDGKMQSSVTRSIRQQPIEELDDVYRFYKSLMKPQAPIPYLSDRGVSYETQRAFHIRTNDTSTNPIVIPLIEQGNFKGYVARRVDDVKDRKYKNNLGLIKETTLPGTLVAGKRVIVAEGMFDRIKAYQNGYKNTACILGCTPSEPQLKKIASYASGVLWSTDNDTAGERGYRVARQWFEKNAPSIPVTRFYFGGRNDLGEIESREEMKHCVETSYELVE